MFGAQEWSWSREWRPRTLVAHFCHTSTLTMSTDSDRKYFSSKLMIKVSHGQSECKNIFQFDSSGSHALLLMLKIIKLKFFGTAIFDGWTQQQALPGIFTL